VLEVKVAQKNNMRDIK